MAKLYAIPEETLVGIADAIRTKTGSDEQMPYTSFQSAIEGIPSGGGGMTLVESGIYHNEAESASINIALNSYADFAFVYKTDLSDISKDSIVGWVLCKFPYFNVGNVSAITNIAILIRCSASGDTSQVNGSATNSYVGFFGGAYSMQVFRLSSSVAIPKGDYKWETYKMFN